MILLPLFISCFLTRPLNASLSKEDAIEKLHIIKEFAQLSPERSRTEMANSTDFRVLLSNKEQVDWLFHSAKIANRLNDLPLYEMSLKSLYEFISILKANQKSEFLFLLGHFNLKSNYLFQANKAYICAPKKYSKGGFTLQSIYSLSIVNSYLKKMSVAEDLMMIVHNELRKEKLDASFGATSNALGVFALHKKDYEAASKYFRSSMDIHQKMGFMSGEYNAGLNLLLSSVLHKNLTLYNRLVKRIKRFNKQHNDPDKKLYFELIVMLAEVIDTGAYSELGTEVATSKINTISSQIVKTASLDFIAPKLGVSITLPIDKVKSPPKWVIDILFKEKCVNETITPEILFKMANETKLNKSTR